MLVRTCGSSKPGIVRNVYNKISAIRIKFSYKTGKNDFIAYKRGKICRTEYQPSHNVSGSVISYSYNEFVDKKKKFLQRDIFAKRNHMYFIIHIRYLSSVIEQHSAV